MDVQKILKFTRNYRGLFDERISTWLFRRYIKDSHYTGITWFNDEHISIYFSSKEYIERRVWMLGEYETEVNAAFRTHVPTNGTVLDVGANIGINTLRLSNFVGVNGKVYSFEPIPHNQQRFAKNILLNNVGNVKLEPIGLGLVSETLTIDFNVEEENMGAVSLRNTSALGIDIQVKNGDEWIQENNIEKLDFIKIDVEGYEWNVISGLSSSIKKFHPKILIEWDLNYLKFSGASDMDWQSFIDSNNYKIYQINRYELKAINSIREAEDGNLLFI